MSNTQSTKLLTITQKAAEKIAVFMKEETDKPEYLRVYVQGGGCSGLSYGMSFEKAKEEDSVGPGRTEATTSSYFTTKTQTGALPTARYAPNEESTPVEGSMR